MFHTYDELKEAVCDYIEYYNNHQYQKRLNRITPIEYRKHLTCAA
ncbi:MAG: IS3 family transposase [Dorea sp.]